MCAPNFGTLGYAITGCHNYLGSKYVSARLLLGERKADAALLEVEDAVVLALPERNGEWPV